MKVTNTNDYSHSIGYVDPEKGKLNYTFEAGQSREDIPNEHEYLFTGIEGFEIGESKSSQEVSTEEEQKVESSEETTPEVFTCTECGKEFTARVALAGHMRSHPEKEENGTSTN